MKRLLILLLCTVLADTATAAEKTKSPSKPGTDADVKSTIWSGKIASIGPANIKVTDAKGKSRTFQIYPGTIFGRGGSAALADFKVGDQVTVSFSEVPGSNVGKAENISAPRTPRKKAQ